MRIEALTIVCKVCASSAEAGTLHGDPNRKQRSFLMWWSSRPWNGPWPGSLSDFRTLLGD